MPLDAGDGSAYQLGNGSNSTSLTQPTLIRDVFTDQRYIAVTCGELHACALQEDGRVICWGFNNHGQCGRPFNPAAGFIHVQQPALIEGEHTFRRITAGGMHTCGIRTSDNVTLCWCANTLCAAVCGLRFAVSAKQLAALDAHHRGFGQALGDGDPLRDKMTPTVLWNGQAFTRIAAGNLHTCGLLVDGTAVCWCACSPGAWAGLGYVCCMQWGQGGCVGPT